jgi:hypothetical protein
LFAFDLPLFALHPSLFAFNLPLSALHPPLFAFNLPFFAFGLPLEDRTAVNRRATRSVRSRLKSGRRRMGGKLRLDLELLEINAFSGNGM